MSERSVIIIVSVPFRYSVLTRIPHQIAAAGERSSGGGGGGGGSDTRVGLAFESGADGCTGGSCRIRFVTLPVAF